MKNRLFSILISAFIVSLATTTVSAATFVTPELASLKEKFKTEYTLAANRGPYSGSAYRLGFSISEVPGAETVGNVLRAIDLQEATLKEVFSDPFPEKIITPANDLKTNGGLLFIEANIARDCRHCKTASERIAFAKATHEMMKIYDVQAAGARSPRSKVKFSGLPFFETFAARFADRVFQQRAIAFHRELNSILAQQIADPKFVVTTNVADIALKICNGNAGDAIELAALMLSRDSNTIKYFTFLPNPKNDEFIRSASMSALLVRLVVGLEEARTGNPDDHFSFDGKYSVDDSRNYYFWSGALVSEELRRQGVSAENSRELNLQFTRHYKILRWYEDQAMRLVSFVKGNGLGPNDQTSQEFHARRTMRITGAGARFSEANACSALFKESL